MEDDVAKRSLGRWLGDYAGTVLSGGLLLLLATGTVVYHLLEDWSWVDSFYFSAIALSTVGFGDLSPTTDGSKLFTVLYLAIGIGSATAYLNHRFNRVSERGERLRGRRTERRQRPDDSPRHPV